MSQRYIGGLETLNPTPLNPALGNAANGIFSMSQYFSLKNQGLWPAIDPYFDYTTLLLHGNGTNGAQNNTFLDSSTNNFTITRNGNTTQGTFTPYGSNWSNFFSSSQLSVANSTNLDLGSGNWTIEAWLYPTSFADYARFFSKQASSGLGFLARLQITTGYVFLEIDQTGIVTSSTAPALNTWSHVAIVRSSNTVTIYINGTSAGSASYSGTPSSQTAKTTVSGFDSGPAQGEYFPGYISNLRFVKGSAVYTSNFTPSTAPLTAITNTQLLTCQNNRFIDNSSNAFTVTVNVGSPSVQRFSPFNPSAPYAAGTIGGSGYFDGSGDYLDASASAGLGGSGNFTLQAWIYPTTVAGDCCIYETRGGTGWVFFINSSGYLQVYDSTATLQTASTTLLKAYQWTHVALVKNSSTCTYYVNGSAAGTFTLSTFQSATRTRVGARNDAGAPYFGWISDLRTDTTNLTITVPTAPLTAGANTNFLLNMTNGGIIDNTMMNDLQTVGNAQISTTQSKFGGASINLSGGANWLLMASSQNFAMGTGDFTVEAWVYPTSSLSAAYNVVFSVNATGGLYFGNTTTGFGLRALSVGDICVTTAPSVNTWTHIAVTRSGTTVRLFYNGVQQNSATSSQNFVVGTGNMGSDGSGSNNWPGYIDDLRITKGIARYTSNFTPQTSQWQDQ